jgi:hypothetical protein
LKKQIGETNRKSISRSAIFLLLLILVVTAATFSLGELLLRVIPIPGVEFNASKYDSNTGATYYPNAETTYRSVNGDSVVRKANRFGYLDIDHDKEKRPGIFRIGLFGDSYTAARQVNLDETFCRIIGSGLIKYNVETLCFGIPGYSTLQSYLTSNKYTNFFDIDMVVYVFSENDLGDQIPEIKGVKNIPFAKLVDGSFSIDYSFRKKTKYKNSLLYKIGDYLSAHSLLITTLYQRITMLWKHGIKIRLTENEKMMATKPEQKTENHIPTSTDLPSTWPVKWKTYATKLDELIILKWKNDVESDSRQFVIFYIPRPREWMKPTELQDSWKPWLENLCKTHGITFIDPSESFLKAYEENKQLYDDHFAPDGHRAFADAFLQWFNPAMIR